MHFGILSCLVLYSGGRTEIRSGGGGGGDGVRGSEAADYPHKACECQKLGGLAPLELLFH